MDASESIEDSAAVASAAALPYIHALVLRGSEQLAEDVVTLKQRHNVLEQENVGSFAVACAS